jgi:hypothetical protein
MLKEIQLVCNILIVSYIYHYNCFFLLIVKLQLLNAVNGPLLLILSTYKC